MQCYCGMLKICFIYMLMIDFLLCGQTNQSEKQKLLVLVLGGFRYDFIKSANKTAKPGFNRIQTLGFVQTTIINEFVTSMGPNLFSLVTGCHSETHGIVDDIFFDKTLNATFDLHALSVSSQSDWYNPAVKPLWVANQQDGHQSLVTSQWPGAAAVIDGLQPTYYQPSFSKSLSLGAVIDKALQVLKDQVTLSLIYYDEPKLTAQKFGPYSSQLQSKISQLDADIDKLVSKIEKSSQLHRSLNVMVTSDHGMSSVKKENIIVLDDILNRSLYESPGPELRAVWPIWPPPGVDVSHLFNSLVNNKSDGMEVKYKHDMKDVYYANNDRIAPIIVYAKPGWLIARSRSERDKFDMSGAYGYALGHEMSPFLIAFGPGIKPNADNKSLDLRIVDLYPFICHLLDLRGCGKHNGSLAKMQHLFRIEESNAFATMLDISMVGLAVALCTVLAALITLCTCRNYWSARCKAPAVLQRRARRRRSNQSVVHRTPDAVHFTGQSRSSGQFLIPVSDNEEVELLATLPGQGGLQQELQQKQFRVDDAALIDMLHGPRSRYP